MTNTEEVPAAKKARIEPATDVVELKLDQAAADAVQKIESDEAEINKIIDEQSEAIIKLEQEYVAKLMPIYNKRSEEMMKIPNFWSTAFQNHPEMSGQIDEADLEVLKSLREIKVDLVNKDVPNPRDESVTKTLNWSVKFVFDENDYFTDKEITKSFYQLGENIISETTPSEISWKEGKNLIENTKKESDADAAGDDTDDEMEFAKLEAGSFFTWFIDHNDPVNDEIGEHIREDLWPHAMNYFLNDLEESEDELAEVDLEDEEEEETAE